MIQSCTSFYNQNDISTERIVGRRLFVQCTFFGTLDTLSKYHDRWQCIALELIDERDFPRQLFVSGTVGF